MQFNKMWQDVSMEMLRVISMKLSRLLDGKKRKYSVLATFTCLLLEREYARCSTRYKASNTGKVEGRN